MPPYCPAAPRTPIASALVVLLMLAVPAVAADPILGTWRLNVAESKFSSAMQPVPPKQQVETIREVERGQMIELSQEGVGEDGMAYSFRIRFPAQGGAVTILNADGSDGMSFTEVLIRPGEWYAVTHQNGKQVILRHKVVSADGSTKRETVRGVDDQDQPFEQIEVYERQ